MRRAIRISPLSLGSLGVAAVLLVAAIAYFQPQKLFINQRSEESAPGAGSPSGGSPPAGSTVLRSGSLQSLEHPSSGKALLLQLPDGQRILRFEDLATSNGPELRVYLSSMPASSDARGYDRDFIDLGALKGNLGNQNYAVPPTVDLGRYRSAVIWCRRFSVGFAVASLTDKQPP